MVMVVKAQGTTHEKHHHVPKQNWLLMEHNHQAHIFKWQCFWGSLGFGTFGHPWLLIFNPYTKLDLGHENKIES
jgi:hypothetical protein